MTDFLEDWGVLIVAVVALLQPGAIWVWSNFVRRGSVDIYETGLIDVGFTQFGASIGFMGTLRAIHKDQFVSSMTLTLVRLSDKSQRAYKWGVFRPLKMTVGPITEYEIPSGFMLTTAEPRRYNILFFDLTSQENVSSHTARLLNGWNEALSDSGILELVDQPDLQQAAVEQAAQVYTEFLRSDLYLEVYGEIGRLIYWEPGAYSAEIAVETTRPGRTFNRKWRFTLTDDACKRLRLNASRIADAACGRLASQFSIESVNYEVASDE